MSNRFQFSMARLFLAVTTFCMAAFFFSFALRPGIDETLALVIVGVAGATLSTGIAALVRSVLIGMFVGLPLAFALWFFLPSPLR